MPVLSASLHRHLETPLTGEWDVGTHDRALSIKLGVDALVLQEVEVRQGLGNLHRAVLANTPGVDRLQPTEQRLHARIVAELLALLAGRSLEPVLNFLILENSAGDLPDKVLGLYLVRGDELQPSSLQFRPLVVHAQVDLADFLEELEVLLLELGIGATDKP